MLDACGTLRHEDNRVKLDFLEKDCMHVISFVFNAEVAVLQKEPGSAFLSSGLGL